MNELVKSQLDATGFEVTLNSMDWNALLHRLPAGGERWYGAGGEEMAPSSL
jgi:peptide/nickel transport system substrate-binding protein